MPLYESLRSYFLREREGKQLLLFPQLCYRTKEQMSDLAHSVFYVLTATCSMLSNKRKERKAASTRYRTKEKRSDWAPSVFTATSFILSDERESDDPSEPRWLRGVLCKRHEQYSVNGFWDLAQYTVGLAYFRSRARPGQNGWSTMACDSMNVTFSLRRGFTFSFPCRFFHFHLITFPFQEMSFLLVIQRAFIVIHSWGLWAERKRRDRERPLHKDKLRMSNPIWNLFFPS